MSVELTQAVWIPGTVTQAHYGSVMAHAEGDMEDVLDDLLAEVERKAEALGATHVCNLLVDAVLGEKGTKWVVTGSALALRWVR